MRIVQCSNPEVDYPLVDFQAGLLTGEEFRRVEAHIRVCQACNSKIEHMQLLANGLRQRSSEFYGEHPTTTEIVVYVDDRASLSEDVLKRIQNHIDTCSSCSEEIEKITQLNKYLLSKSDSHVSRSATNISPTNNTRGRLFNVLRKPALAYLLTAASLALLVNEHLTERAAEEVSPPEAITTQSTAFNQPELILSESRTVTLQADDTQNGAVVAKSLHKPLVTKIIRTEGESVVRTLVVTPEPDLEHYRYSIKLKDDTGREWTLADNFVDFGVTVSNETVTNLALDLSSVEDGQYILMFTAHDREQPKVVYPVQYLLELITTNKTK